MTTAYPPADDPDQIRRDIERTQDALSNDVDTLSEKITPSRIVERRVERVRGRMTDWRDQVMGSPDDNSPGAAQHALDSTGSAVSDTASSAVETVQDAPQALRRQAQGNPLAAGIIAFGAGWLISSLLPASRREQELAGMAKDRASELGKPLAGVAAELKDQLAEPAQQAVAAVRSTATDAGQTVVEEGRGAAGSVRDDARDAAGTVRQNSSAN